MAEMFKVCRGGSPPVVDRRRKGGRHKFPVEEMSVGDWFLVPHRTTRSVSAYISRITKNLPGKFITRTVWMAKKGEDWEVADARAAGAVSGVQVWRTE